MVRKVRPNGTRHIWAANNNDQKQVIIVELTQEELMYIADNVERLLPFNHTAVVFVAIACVIIGGVIGLNADKIDFPNWVPAAAIMLATAGSIVCTFWLAASAGYNSIYGTVRQAAYLKYEQTEIENLVEALDNNELRLEKKDEAENEVKAYKERLNRYEKMSVQQLTEIYPKELEELRQSISEAIGRDFQWCALALDTVNIDL